MRAVALQTEYLNNPIGIGTEHPRMLWICEDGVKQSAYQVRCTENDTVLWDSGKVSSSSMHADYPHGSNSRQRITWQVKLWDETDQEGEWSEPAFFEWGLLHPSDWKAEWISGNYKVNKKVRYPVDCFRKCWDVAGEVVRARLYISACGLYEATLNGKRVGDFVFAPGSTDYRKRIQYQSYDVTDLLQSGENTMEVLLADGWYRGSNGAKGRRNTYGTETKLIYQLEITDASGKVRTICSDTTTAWSNDGPLRFADLKDGEIVEAGKRPSYGGYAKTSVCNTPLTTSDNYAVREQERFHPVEKILTPSGKTVLKFPQNLSGYLSFSLQAKEGDTISITLGEVLDETGELSLKNIQCIHHGKKTPLQELHYTCKEGRNTYTSKFFFGGFQYAQVETTVAFEPEDFTAVAVYSDFEETSAFTCSHPLINQLYRNTLWSLKSNSTDIPTDCPTRERMGWTGDSQVFFNTASFMVGYAPFARKHVRDIFDRQWKNGKLPQIVPFANEDWFMGPMNGSVGWACAGVYIPLYYYEKYGDRRLLETYYERILKYADFMISRAGKWGGPYAKPIRISRKNQRYLVNCGQSYGEWAEPNDVNAFQWYDFASPHPEESTAYTYFTLSRVLKIAEILGKPVDAHLEKIRRYSEGARSAYQELVEKKEFSLNTDRQAKLVRPLYMKLLTEEQEQFARKRLIEAMEHYGFRLGTGFLSTPFILEVLAEQDIEYAYRLLENEELPGWLYIPKHGATTIWEAWEGNSTPDAGIASLNHYSKGAVCQWLIEHMCGIQISGENHFVIAPQPGGSLHYAEASYRSAYGMIESKWERKENQTVYTITVPVNCTAEICLPSGQREIVTTGTYQYEESGNE